MFNEIKATALALLFLSKTEKLTMDYLKLIKLLYLTDRLLLKGDDKVITHDTYVAMKYGPVLSNVFHLISSNNNQKKQESDITNNTDPSWYNNIATEKSKVKIRNKETYGNIIAKHLNEQEKHYADRIVEEFINVKTWDLVEYTHFMCKEWKSPAPFGVRPIYIKDIKKAISEEL